MRPSFRNVPCPPRLAAIAAVLVAAACAPPRAKEPTAPAPNAVQAKVWSFVPAKAGTGLTCEPVGQLNALLNEPNNCSGDLDKCALGAQLATGKAPPATVDLFADLLRLDDPERQKDYFEPYPLPPYQARCPFRSAAAESYLEELALQGLGYAGARRHAGVLADIVEKGYFDKLNVDRPVKLVEALWRTADRERGARALARTLDPSFRARPPYRWLALQYLGRWRAPDAKDYCLRALASPDDDDTYRSCAYYLGALGEKGALPALERNFDKYGEETARALAMMGAPESTQPLERYLERHDGASAQRTPALVALINLGKVEYFAELEEAVRGLPAQRKADRERGRPRTTLTDDRLAQRAMMEGILLRHPTVGPKFDEALRTLAAEQDDKKWRLSTYANVALAYRGDAAAAQRIARLLNGPSADVRKAVLNAVGARDSEPHFLYWERGPGALADEGVARALEQFVTAEADPAGKLAGVHALVNVRAAIANRR